MAKKTAKPKWTRAKKPKRKSRIWWVWCEKPSVHGSMQETVVVSLTKPMFVRWACGCRVTRDKSWWLKMSLAQYRARFANAPELKPGGPPRRVRLRMEVA